MKFENIKVSNFENAFRGMRNPKNSWRLSDSKFGLTNNIKDEILVIADKWIIEKDSEWGRNDQYPTVEQQKKYSEIIKWLSDNGILHEERDICEYAILHGEEDIYEYALIGPKDMKLAKTLIAAGSEHRKFMRQIFVSVDITAPLYWWKEADTYKVGTTANSTSTMHTLQNKPITLDCFEIGDYDPEVEKEFVTMGATDFIINYCEWLRKKYIATNDKKYWKELIRWLPESWLQTRTWTANYETLLRICSPGQRRNHKLTEWSIDFMNFAKQLPYASDLIFI